jgi:DNA polymerase-3 subunit gamma/tau
LLKQFRNLLLRKIAPESLLPDLTDDEREEIGRQAEMIKGEKLQVILNFLIGREETLRFTSNPRLILETILIKLCRLDDYLNFEELLSKIELLEKRLTGNVPENKEAETGYLRDPGIEWIPDSGEEKTDEGGKKLVGEDGWKGFLKFLSSKSQSMYNNLKGWQFIRLTEKKLEIRGSNQAFSSAYFDNPAMFEQLIHYCREFFGRPIRVEIKKNNEAKQKKKDRVLKETHTRVPSELRDLSSTVKNILDVFEGEIKRGPQRNHVQDAPYQGGEERKKEVKS